MSLSGEQRRRVADLTRELYEILGNSVHSDGRPMTFSELEDECIEVGDLLTAAVLQQRVAERSIREEASCCPGCGQECTPLGEDEARVLQTDRGEVAWMESAYQCSRCRRNFFPSDGRIGPGSGRHSEPAGGGENGLLGSVCR